MIQENREVERREMRREEEKDGGDKEITEAMPEPGQKLRRRGREVCHTRMIYGPEWFKKKPVLWHDSTELTVGSIVH